MITRRHLLELLDYDPITGIFRWRVSKSGHIIKGRIAGSVHSQGYRFIGIDGESYAAHHLAWLIVKGRWPKNEIDHQNLQKDDNWIDNLREATHGENQHNCRAYRNNTSGFKGVTFHRESKKWVAQIQKNGKNYYIGLFAKREIAHTAYCAKAKELYGDFARPA